MKRSFNTHRECWLKLRNGEREAKERARGLSSREVKEGAGAQLTGGPWLSAAQRRAKPQETLPQTTSGAVARCALIACRGSRSKACAEVTAHCAAHASAMAQRTRARASVRKGMKRRPLDFDPTVDRRSRRPKPAHASTVRCRSDGSQRAPAPDSAGAISWLDRDEWLGSDSGPSPRNSVDQK